MRVGHSGGASFVVPGDWARLDVDPATVAAREPVTPPGFPASLVLNGTGARQRALEDWWSQDGQALPGLADYLLLDEGATSVAEREGRWRLAHHAGPDGKALVMEQWSVVADDVVWTLTARIDTPRWTTSAAALQEMAATLALPGDTRGEPP